MLRSFNLEALRPPPECANQLTDTKHNLQMATALASSTLCCVNGSLRNIQRLLNLHC